MLVSPMVLVLPSSDSKHAGVGKGSTTPSGRGKKPARPPEARVHEPREGGTPLVPGMAGHTTAFEGRARTGQRRGEASERSTFGGALDPIFHGSSDSNLAGVRCASTRLVRERAVAT